MDKYLAQTQLIKKRKPNYLFMYLLIYHSLLPLKPGLDAAAEAVCGVDLVVPHVEQNLQQLLLVLRPRQGLCLLRPHHSLKQSVPGVLVRAQFFFN